jgi:hypothetical protein
MWDYSIASLDHIPIRTSPHMSQAHMWSNFDTASVIDSPTCEWQKSESSNQLVLISLQTFTLW